MSQKMNFATSKMTDHCSMKEGRAVSDGGHSCLHFKPFYSNSFSILWNVQELFSFSTLHKNLSMENSIDFFTPSLRHISEYSMAKHKVQTLVFSRQDKNTKFNFFISLPTSARNKFSYFLFMYVTECFNIDLDQFWVNVIKLNRIMYQNK